EYRYKLPENKMIPIKKNHPAHNKLAASIFIINKPTAKIETVWNIWQWTAFSHVVNAFSDIFPSNPCALTAPKPTAKKPLIAPITNNAFIFLFPLSLKIKYIVWIIFKLLWTLFFCLV